jgi:hypothetical protein
LVKSLDKRPYLSCCYCLEIQSKTSFMRGRYYTKSCLLHFHVYHKQVFVSSTVITLNFHCTFWLHLSNSFSTFNCPLNLNLIDVSYKSERVYSLFDIFFCLREVVTKPYVFIPRNGVEVAPSNVHFLLLIVLLNLTNWGKFGTCGCC